MDKKQRSYTPQQVPGEISLTLLDWLRRELRAVQARFQQDGLDITALEDRADVLEDRADVLEDRADETDVEQAIQDAELARLERDKLDIADAVATFSFAAYGDLVAPNNSAFADLDGTWQKVDVLTASAITARRIVMIPASSAFAFQHEGVYNISVSGSFEHNSENSGRITYVRLYNQTDGVPVGSGIALGTGRNAESTNISSSFLVEVSAAKYKDIILQIGGGDDYSGVSFQSLVLSINAEGEWREPLG